MPDAYKPWYRDRLGLACIAVLIATLLFIILV